LLNFRFASASALFAFCFAAFPSAALPRQEAAARTISALQVESAPAIDGLLDDPCWRAADWQGDFVQLKPSPGEPARAATRVAVAYDRGHIYAAFRCFNPTGPGANSRITSRDGNMDLDNAVTLYLDTFHTRRDCYYFSTNSLGTQVDGRIGQDGAANDKKWDCTWSVASRQDSLGWSCEMKIPVSGMRIPRGENRIWGINFRRNYPKLFETSFWRRRDVAWRISQSGDLLGLPAFDKLFSATLYPYLVGLDSDQPLAGRRRIMSSGGSELVGGADLSLRLGNAMDVNITCNPDFATVEADLTQINLTRYETFYPEKRLYFLEGAELFSHPINLFHSRRIGDIDWGLKTNGRIGRYNYAVLAAGERTAGDDPAAHTEAFRLQRDILGSSNIGMTAVSRTWDGGYARVLSSDGVLYFTPKTRLRGQLVGSFPSSLEEEFTAAGYVQLSHDTGLRGYRLTYSNLEPGFKDNVNRVGFIQDDNRHQVESWANGEIWINRRGIDRISYNQSSHVVWGYDGALRKVHAGGWTGVTFLRNWLVGYGYTYETELFEKRFRNSTQLTEMAWDNRISRNWNVLHVWGRNFDRDFSRTRLRGSMKATDRIFLEAAVTCLRFSPDTTGRGTELYDLHAVYHFTSDLWIQLTSQYTSSKDRLYFYGLFGWRFAPPFGALYLAYTRDRFDTFDELHRTLSGKDQRAFFVKLTVPLAIY